MRSRRPRHPRARRRPRRRSRRAHGEHLRSNRHEPAEPAAPPEPPPARPLRVANCSGFYGDRLAAAREMVEGGPDRRAHRRLAGRADDADPGQGPLKDPDGGLRHDVPHPDGAGARHLPGPRHQGGRQRRRPQPGRAAPTALARARRPGSGLTPPGRPRRGRRPAAAPRRAAGRRASTSPTSTPASRSTSSASRRSPPTPTSAAGASPTRSTRGADVVITGRVTDAAVVVGPAAWHFGWDARRLGRARRRRRRRPHHRVRRPVHRRQLRLLRGGARARAPGLPHRRDRTPTARSSSPSTPAPAALVSVGTVTAQLLYEIQGLGVRQPRRRRAPSTLDPARPGGSPTGSGCHGVARPAGARRRRRSRINYLGGFRNTMTFVLTGLDIEAKAELAERTLWSLVPGGREAFDAVDVRLRRTDRDDPATNDDAVAELRITVMDRDESKVGRAFSNTVIEMVLASYPGFFTTTPAERRLDASASTGRRWCPPTCSSTPSCSATSAPGRPLPPTRDRRRQRGDPAATSRDGTAATGRPETCRLLETLRGGCRDATPHRPGTSSPLGTARPGARRPLGRQGRQRQRRRVGPRRRRLRLAAAGT